MAHLVAVLFHHLEVYQRVSGGQDLSAADRLARLRDYVIESLRRWQAVPGGVDDDLPRAALTLSSRWFDAEITPVLGVDVMATPFLFDRGYALTRVQRADVAVVRYEDLGWAGAEVARTLCGIDGFVVPVEKGAQDRPSGWLYEAFLRQCRLPRDLVEAVYATPYARHFYRESERNALIARWSAPV
jgi:hypothetical protein